MTNANLSLNFAPVSMSGDTKVSAGTCTYSPETLQELRAAHAESHVFHWDRRNNKIVDVPVIGETGPLGTELIDVDIADAFWLWPALLTSALVRTFAGKREIIRDYPLQVLGHEKSNLIAHESLPTWIQKRTLQEFTPRTLFGHSDVPTFGLLCDVRTRNQILGSCAQLIERGISVQGQYVLVDGYQGDKRISARPQLAGRVARVEGDELVLEDHREGCERVSSASARLTGRLEVFDWCVREFLGSASEAILEKSRLQVAERTSGPGRLHAIEGVLEYLRGCSLEAAPGISIEVGELLNSSDTRFPPTEGIPKPALVFDPSGARTDVWNERGIKTNGPYDQRTFTPKKLNIAVICQGRYEGQVDAFIAKFLDGMPTVKTGGRNNRQARYGDGFLRRYQLEKPNVQTFTAKSPTIDAYTSACDTALQKAADDGFAWDLALVQIEEQFKTLPGNRNPYFGTKALLLKNHVAVQNVRLETIRQPDQNLVFSMNQMSLASYAKLGGRPWLLKTEQKVAHELVIGIGSHTTSTSRIGSGVRHVGITTLFSSDGSYHLSDRTNVVPFEEYSNALTETLQRTIVRVRDEDNWRNTDHVRLIFHMFKPAKDIEAEAIKATVEGLDLENVSYAFLHIATHHPFLVFDHDQLGLPHWKPEKGILGPSRGAHLKLGDSQSLVVFSGASELKRATDGMPRPCLLRLHRDSTFRDMTYLARQAFDFSAHSWRIMSPESFPITIKYSDLIAERLAGLSEIPIWDSDAVRFREIGRTPWFL